MNWGDIQAGENNFWYELNNSDRVIVFVHGFFSESRTAWLHEDSQGNGKCFWPDIISNDERFQNPSIYLAGFYTALDAGIYGFENAAEDLLSALGREDEHGQRPVLTFRNIVFVCHSTGGIVVRYLLERHWEIFADKRVGLVLIASPSYGSELADRLGWLARLYNQKLGLQLKWGNSSLKELDQRFKDIVHERKIPELFGVEAYENHFIFKPRWMPPKHYVVTDESAGRYFGAPKLLRKTDHFTAAKPNSARHPSHELLVDFWVKHFRTEAVASKLRLLNSRQGYEITGNEKNTRFGTVTLWRSDTSYNTDERRSVVFDVDQYSTVKELLDDIYLSYLAQDVRPATYGSEWLLQSGHILVPPEWAFHPGTAIHEVNLMWITNMKLTDVGLVAHSSWNLITGEKVREIVESGVHLVLCNTANFVGALTAYPKVTEFLLMNEKLFSHGPARIDLISSYKYAFVQQSLEYTDSSGSVFVETQESMVNRKLLDDAWKIAMNLA